MINDARIRDIIVNAMDRKNELGIRTPVEPLNYVGVN